MSTAVDTSAVRLNTATVTQYLASEKGLASDKRKAVLLRAAPVWEEAPEVAWGERRALVATAVSPLAVYELVLNHLVPGAGGPEVLVVLTDQEETELGTDLLAQVHKRRVNAVDTWDVVRETFGAQHVDARLFAENWAAEALLDASPPSGWPRLAGGPLTRRHALTSLALRRLGAGRYEPDQAKRHEGNVTGSVELDLPTLLRWSLSAGGPDRFLALRVPEQAGLTRFLGEEDQAGAAGQALLALVAAGHGADAVAFGLVCGALWVHAAHSVDAEDYRARGRAERWFGDEPPARGEALDALATALGQASEEFVTTLLLNRRADDDDAAAANRLSATVLDRSASLIRQFGAERAAGTSPVLAAGLEAGFTAVGQALTRGDTERIAKSVQELRHHRLAYDQDAVIRIVRATMAQRLAQWLTTEPAKESETIAAAIDRHLAETSWADLALEHIEAGGDSEPGLKAAYDKLCLAVRARRREIDQYFARALAAWTSAGTGARMMLTVESFLARVVGPAVKAGERRVLLVVLDGMSAAIAAELGEELRRDWAEYDPLPDAKDSPRRRGMAAALPTVTAVSRTSLFAGKLMVGSQHQEQVAFSEHTFWGNQQAAVFHKNALRAGTGGEVFGPELYEAMSGDRVHVAVVLNTIDDRLANEQKLGDGAWRLGDMGGLRELLRLAAEQGRAVLLTSDHGHVVDRHGAKAEASASPLSARHRAPGGALGENEIELTGQRVVSPDTGGVIVALWDADSRYTARKAGYHGGASLAEFVIPVLALLPFGAVPPKGWRELGRQQPSWWSSAAETTTQTPAEPTVPPKRAAKKRHIDAEQAASKQSLFELALVPDGKESLLSVQPVYSNYALVTDLLKSELFVAQSQSLARKPDLVKVEKALRALLDAGCVLPVTALAQRVGLPVTRADGFSAVLRQLLNFDGVQVLETLPDGRTLRLNTTLVKEQFELKRAV
ncbi:BREX-2 system phosphatase PglZ [Amycolatopsis thailandensis]|uniref:BREX-2 system phosphatase PglZ n=1 Tax=Amycolatopsis thailandensis TaxID=589330 RepID=UPI0037AE6A16